MLDLRQLRYFVAVAESENIGQAAERLHISQSPLSRQIMQLEAQLGLSLFERVRQRVRLTAEGREFLREARELLAQAERLETRAQRLGDGSAGSLMIGYVEGAVHAGLIGATLKSFRRGRRDLELHLVSQRSHAQFEGLRQHTLDIGFTYAAPPADDPDLAGVLIRSEPLLLALPPGDPLSELGKIAPADLDGTIWITVVRQPNDTNRDAFLAACVAAGFMPKIAYETADPLTSLGLVGAGLGLAVVQDSLRAIAPPEVVFRDLPWFDRTVSLYLVWRRSDARSLIAAFRTAAETQSPR